MIMVAMSANGADNITAKSGAGGQRVHVIAGTDSGTSATIRTLIFQGDQSTVWLANGHGFMVESMNVDVGRHYGQWSRSDHPVHERHVCRQQFHPGHDYVCDGSPATRVI